MEQALSRHRSLITGRLPVPVATYPDSSEAIGTVEFLSEVYSFHGGSSSHYRGIPVNAHHHVADVDGIIAKLPAFAGCHGVRLCNHLAKGRDAQVIIGEGALCECGIALHGRIFGLALQVENLADVLLTLGSPGRRLGERIFLPYLSRACKEAKNREQHQQESAVVSHET